jgi:O-antigen/teichoic acid export membrane protein
MSRDLDRSLVTGIGWTALFRWLAQLVSWVATFYAARLLAPADYGIVAMAMIPIGLVRLIEDFGFDVVILQNQDLTRDQMARLGGLAVAFSVGLAILLCAAAPLVAAFNSEPAVTAMIIVLSAVIVLDALQIVPRALMQRDLEFRWLGIIYALQVAATSIALVVSAAGGAGPWALIFNTLAGSAASTLLLFWRRPFMPSWPRDIASISSQILAGWRMLVSRAAYYANTTADQVLIGRMLGKDPLGHYSFAMTIASIPIQEITSLVSRVVPGIFSTVQKEPALLRRYFLMLTEALTIVAFPVCFGLLLTAERVVPIALGPQWGDVVVPLRILTLYMAAYAAQVLVSHVLLWTGHFRQLMWFSMLGLFGLVPAMIVGIKLDGLHGLAWTWVIVYPLVSLPPLFVARRVLEMRWMELLGALAPASVACAVMAATVLTAKYLLGSDPNEYLALFVEASVGAATYCGFLWFAYRRRLLALFDVIRSARTWRTGASSTSTA